jgi:hypothetical protein
MKPTPTPSPGVTPTPHATPTPGITPTPLPTSSPTSSPTPLPTTAPTPVATYYPPDPPSIIRSTYGRIGLAQIFDYFPATGTQMSSSQIEADASRYDLVWASFPPSPQLWRQYDPQAPISRYYIPEEDNILISGHDLQWWEQNHPDWILYACESNGTPTHNFAYTPDDGFADVPLDIHNPSVVQYQLQTLIPYAQQNDYNAIALDEIIFEDVMEGGNPELGQTVQAGEYGCGIWNDNGTFTTVYSGPNDPTWTSDILNWVESAKQAASAAGLSVIINHPPGDLDDPNEEALMQNVNATVDEAGFSDYGNYTNQDEAALFGATYRYMEWVQKQGVAIVDIDRFASDGPTITSDHLEYSIATYLMANEGNADLFALGGNGTGYGYGAEQYHPEYATQIGPPCSAMYGGPTYSTTSPQIYYRRFENGMVVVNSGSMPVPSEDATLPSDHVYQDIEGRPVTNPLVVDSNDAYVLTTNGNGCQ